MVPLPKSSRPSPRGAVTWVGLLLLVLLAGGAYLAWTWVPVYVIHYEARQVVRDFGNQAVKNPNDAAAGGGHGDEAPRRLGPWPDGPRGRRAPRPVVDLRPQDVTWERVEPASLHVAFEYERDGGVPARRSQGSSAHGRSI